MSQQTETSNDSSFVQDGSNLPYGRFVIVLGDPRAPVGPGCAGIASAVASAALNGVGFTGRDDCGEALLLAASLGEPIPAERLCVLDSLAHLICCAIGNAPSEGLSRIDVLDVFVPVLGAIAVEMRAAAALIAQRGGTHNPIAQDIVHSTGGAQ